MEQMQYYCVTTRRFTLLCGHEDWLKITQDYYNEVLLFYYRLFLRTEEKEPGRLTDQTNQQVLRELEILSIEGRDGRTVPWPLPWKRVPLYFRRAAINGAIAEARSYLGRCRAGMASAQTKHFQRGVTFYKGMFCELTDHSVSLKLWDGKVWNWVHCRLKGRELPADTKCMSPTLNLTPKGAVLNVPVRENVEDGRKAKERMQAGIRICSLQFTNEDAFAVGVILEPDGEQAAVRFFRGGLEYTHLCRMRLDKIKESGEAMGLPEYVFYKTDIFSEKQLEEASDQQEKASGQEVKATEQGAKSSGQEVKATDQQEKVPGQEVKAPDQGKKASGQEVKASDQREKVSEQVTSNEVNPEGQSGKGKPDGKGFEDLTEDIYVDSGKKPERYNQKYWMKLKHLNDYYAHRVSREIVDYCKENQAGMIVIPRYDDRFTHYVMGRAGNWSVLGLSRRICSLLAYKAWKAGIVIVEVHAGGTSACCSKCGERVRKHGSEYECLKGHRGNRYLNTARNLGIKCLRGFGRDVV